MVGILLIVIGACVVSLLPKVPWTLRQLAVLLILAFALFAVCGIFVSHRLGWERYRAEQYAHQAEGVHSAFVDGAVAASDASRRFLPLVTVSLFALAVIAFARK